ncbi:MAG: hypothetical protein HY809_03860 [Nitrospirae bacterium]|nr:hypothetical protein [Nitrospirota bacterium]
MKKFVMTLLAMILVAGVSVNASEKSGSGVKQITGSVVAVNPADNTVTVKKKDREILLVFDAKTKVAQCSDNGSIGSIKVGDKVTASYNEGEGSNTAKSITVTEK